MPAKLTLVVGNLAWSNWTSVELASDWLTPADSWSVSLAGVRDVQVLALVPGQEMKLMYGDQLWLRGRIDRRELRRDRNGGTTLSLSGRDLGASLVDNHPGRSTSYRNTSPLGVAARAATQFGLTWSSSGQASGLSTVMETASPKEGETWWDWLDRYARKAQAWLRVTPSGALRFERPDYKTAPVGELIHAPVGATRGTNITTLTYLQDWSRRAGRYIGQNQGSSADYDNQSKSWLEVTDPVVEAAWPSRVLRVNLAARNRAEARQALQVEAQRREYEGTQVSIEVPGWGPTDDTLWQAGDNVVLADTVLGLGGAWWCAGVRWSESRDAGRRAQLDLRLPNILRREVGE